MLKEFEVIGSDGRTYIHDDNWVRWRDRTLYPCPQDHYRFDLELRHPREYIDDVPIERNPHSDYDGYTCFYSNSNWSTIYGVHDAHDVTGTGLKMIVESGCAYPVWGEQISLFSTSSTIEDEPWGHNVANKFALFRGQYWRIHKWKFLHNWTPLRSATRGADGFYDIIPALTRRRHPVALGFDWRNWRPIDEILDDIIEMNLTLRYSYNKPKSAKINWKREGF